MLQMMRSSLFSSVSQLFYDFFLKWTPRDNCNTFDGVDCNVTINTVVQVTHDQIFIIKMV